MALYGEALMPRNMDLTPERPRLSQYVNPNEPDPAREAWGHYEYSEAVERYKRYKLRAVHSACRALAAEDHARAWRWAQGIPEERPQHIDTEPIPF